MSLKDVGGGQLLVGEGRRHADVQDGHVRRITLGSRQQCVAASDGVKDLDAEVGEQPVEPTAKRPSRRRGLRACQRRLYGRPRPGLLVSSVATHCLRAVTKSGQTATLEQSRPSAARIGNGDR